MISISCLISRSDCSLSLLSGSILWACTNPTWTEQCFTWTKVSVFFNDWHFFKPQNFFLPPGILSLSTWAFPLPGVTLPPESPLSLITPPPGFSAIDYLFPSPRGTLLQHLPLTGNSLPQGCQLEHPFPSPWGTLLPETPSHWELLLPGLSARGLSTRAHPLAELHLWFLPDYISFFYLANSMLKNEYFHKGGNDPAILAQMRELEYEAQRMQATQRPPGNKCISLIVLVCAVTEFFNG